MSLARKPLPPRPLSPVSVAAVPSGLLCSSRAQALLALVLGPVVHPSSLFLWHPQGGVEGENRHSVAVPLPAPAPPSWGRLGTVASETSWMRAQGSLSSLATREAGHWSSRPWSGHKPHGKCHWGPFFSAVESGLPTGFREFIQSVCLRLLLF